MHTLQYESKKKYDTLDITSDIKMIVKKEKIREGIIVVYTPHATAAIVINENYDPNIQIDFHHALQKLIKEGQWLHDQVDGNAASHIKASLVGPSETLIINKGLVLGQWQDIMLVDFDGPKKRTVIVEIIKK